MRDFINRLSRGSSIINIPKLSCSEEQTTMTTMSDAAAEDSSANDATNDVYETEHADNVHAKEEAVVLTIDNDENTVTKKEEPEKYGFELKKSGTELTQIHIYADAEFIELERNDISTDDFAGDRLDINYIINPEKMHAGNNYGYIHVDSYTQHLKVKVSAVASKAAGEEFEVRWEERQAEYKLTKLYLDFRMKKIKKEKWLSSSMQIVDRIRGIKGQDPFYDLVQVQLLAMSGREESAVQIFDGFKKDIMGRIGDNVELYCYFLYVSTLMVKEEEYTAQVYSQVKKFYENGYDTYRVLWILFYLDPDSESNKSIKLIRIKDTVNIGCTSPVMYIEALNIINAQPVLLRVLNQFEMRVINYGCKNGIITEKLAMQIADVAANEKNISINTLIILKKLYEQFDKDEILTVLVTQMIRMGMTGDNCFEIYEKGVLRGLRITRLYEFYIASMPKNIERQLPKIVLMYFAYDNILSDSDKAFLYANIVTGRDSYYKNIYEGYDRNIEIFVYEQLKDGKISDNLAVLYKALLKTQLISKETGSFISRMPYMHRVRCFSDVVSRVHVRHPEFAEETVYELSEKIAYICMYAGDCEITFECSDGVIRKDTIDYEIEKVFDAGQYEEVFDAAAEYGMDNDGIIMSRINDMHKKSEYTSELLDYYKCIKKSDNISSAYRYQINSWMIEYYYTYYKDNDFWHEYVSVDTDDLSDKDAQRLIETLTEAGMYSQSFELVSRYGCCKAAPARLLKMADYILTNVSDEHNKVLDDVTAYVFGQHIYNEPVLAYMSDYFNGTNDEMYNVWKAAINYGVNVSHMSERLLAQMMYTGVHTGRLTEVFTDYYSKMPDKLIVKAYLSYNSQFYLLRQKKANDIVFRVIEEYMKEGYGLPECCYVAWLKNISKNPLALKEDDSERELAQTVLNELCENDRIYSFYKKFKGVLDIPYNMQGLTIIEYISAPADKVTISYTINGGDRLTQVMKSNEWGIFTCRFHLFYGDVLEYTFSVNDEDNDMQPAVYEFKDVSGENTQGRTDMLNECLASRQQHELAALKKQMHSYSVEEYVTREMFTIAK